MVELICWPYSLSKGKEDPSPRMGDILFFSWYMETVYLYKKEQKREIHVIHTCILANKKTKLSYKLALSKGLENQTITRKWPSNTFPIYIYKKRPCAEFEGQPPPPNQDNYRIAP